MKKELEGWQVVEEGSVEKLVREFEFDDFESALRFVNKVGELAEEEDHHPVITLEWGRVEVVWWSHEEGGVEEIDWEMARECSEAYQV